VKYDVVVSCLASRTGGIKDSWDIDYQATKNVLDVSRENGAKHFVLLSAICVQKPLLTFQSAKLKFEQELAACADISHSIVRPTAFFKSLAGQVESVQKGRSVRHVRGRPARRLASQSPSAISPSTW
jgi:divinyl chlorophyllide a 8-vinyl-reductase